MKINSKILRTLSLVVVLVMVMSSFTFADGIVTKDETVYVNLDPQGVPVEKISSVWLHSDTSLKNIEDRTTLKDIVNVKGDEVPEIKGDNILWNTDKKDIFYQGNTDKDLPVVLRVVYYLDGKKMDPKDMAGKSGKVKINLTIENKDKHVIKLNNGEEKSLYTPFSSVVVMNLPIDKYKNVKTNSGKLISDGNNQVVTYVALPGLKQSLDLDKNIVDIPEYLSVTADVENFEMSPIVVTVTSELPDVNDFENADNFDELIDGIEKIKDASEKLSEATGKLCEGQLSLSDGIEQFVVGVNKVNVGANSLKDGAKKLKDGVNSSYEGSKEISNGVNVLSQSASQLGQGFENLGSGAVEFGSKAKEFSQGASQVANGVAQIPEVTQEMSQGMDTIVDSTGQIVAGQEKLTEGLEKSVKALEEIKKGKEKELQVVEMLLKGLDGLETAANGIGKIPGADGISQKLVEGLQKQKMALEGLKQSSSQLVMGLNQVETGLKEAKEASGQLSSSLTKVNEGQKKVANGSSELAKGTSGLKGASEKLVQGSNGLAMGAEQIDEGAIKANEGAVKFSEGSKALSAGTGKLTTGLGQLNLGASELYNGTEVLSEGTNELAKGSNVLKEGSQKLANGTKELDENMKKFHEEGIVEMSNRVNDSDIDIDSIMETKDKLVNLSKEYNSFTGLNEDMDGTVKFVMKTEEVKGKEEKEHLDMENEVEEKNNFMTWLKSLFTKKK